MHAAFWTGAAISLLALLGRRGGAAAGRRMRPPGGSTCVGAVLLGAGLAGLPAGPGRGRDLGPALAACSGRWRPARSSSWPAGWSWESRTPSPLVDLRLARGRVAGTAHVAALLVGLANYLLLASIPILAQAPAGAGAGFGTSIVVAGLILLPFSLASLVAGRVARAFADRAAARLVLPRRGARPERRVRAVPRRRATSCGSCSCSWPWPGSASGPPSRRSRR